MNEGIFNQLSEGQRGLQLATGFECPTCYDSHIDCVDGLAATCLDCVFQYFSHERACQQLNDAIRHLEDCGLSLDAKALDCARALVRATSERPVRGTVLGVFLRVNEREVKRLIEVLRNEWHLPIGSLREPPYGYYWIGSTEDFLRWFEPMRSQALTELRTAYRLMKRHYPELAGQLTFNLEEEVSPE